jgi:hypothetical protein
MKYLIFIMAALLVFSCASAPQPQLFTVDLNSRHYMAGEIEAYFDSYLGIGSLKKNMVTVFYYPIEDAVCLQFKVQFVTCNQFWDKAGRDSCVDAFRRYEEEYEQRKLVKDKKSRDAYGSNHGFFAWKRTPVSAQARGSLQYNIGYHFKDRAVFFSTAQTEAKYEHPVSKRMDQTSPILSVYYTRAQAESLIELFDQEFLQTLEKPSDSDGAGVKEKKEEYYEY